MKNSPTHKYEVLLCKKCDEQINDKTSIRCDECAKLFHKNCVNINSSDDIIWQCTSCINQTAIYSNMDKSTVKSSKPSKTTVKPINKSSSKSPVTHIPRIVTRSQTNLTNANAIPKATTSNPRVSNMDKIREHVNERLEEFKRETLTRFTSFESNTKKQFEQYEQILSIVINAAESNQLKCEKNNEMFRELSDSFDFFKQLYDHSLTDVTNAALSNHEIIDEKYVRLTESFDRCNNMCKGNRKQFDEFQTQLSNIKYELECNKNIGLSKIMNDTDIHSFINADVNNKGLHHGSIETCQQLIDDIKFTIQTMGDAIANHNKTIRTHFDLNNAYNAGIIGKVNRCEHKQMRDIQRSVEVCEALSDVNATCNAEIQRQMYDMIHRLENSLIEGEKYNCDDCTTTNEIKNFGRNTRSKKTIECKTNKFVSPITKIRRFVTPYERYAYTKRLTVQLNGAKIHNIHQFQADFKNEFEKILGKNLISKIIIESNADNPITKQITIDILLCVPLSYEYIDNFKFPVNWSFFVCTNNKPKNIRRRRTSSV